MANTKTTLQTTFKYVQENGLNDLKPNSAILQELAGSLKDSDKVGRKYLAAVALTQELGFTFGDGTAFTYEDDVAGTYDEIEVDPNPVVLKSRLSMEAADRMANQNKAVLSHVALRGGQMKTALMKMAEIECFYGRTGVGKITGTPSVSGDATLTISDATWAPGIWGGMEGAKLEARNGATKINSNADLVLVSVDHDNKQIVVSGNATDLGNLAATHDIYFKGAYANGQYGIDYQMSHSGSIFGIDNSTYSLWKANTHAVGGSLTISEVLKGSAKAVSKGGLDEDSVLLVSARGYESLNSDLAALRSFDSSYSEKAEVGNRGITYKAQFGKLEVIAHPFCKEGEAFLMPKKGLKKIGSTDITFGIPGKEGEYVESLENVSAFQFLCRYSFQVLISAPAKCVKYTGITYA
ncbi:MAG: hypothetical protein ACOH5I_26485 [Oligoflexus sp.]